MSDRAAERCLQAAGSVRDQIVQIDRTILDRPALGEWSLRDLIGHTSRALITVLTYLDRPADRADVATSEAYYATVMDAQSGPDADAVTERGRQAGRDLGDDPAAAFGTLVARAYDRLSTADPDALITTIVGGMRVGDYLPTRTFELVVHGYDVERATGISVDFDPEVVKHVAELTARLAVERGHGSLTLAALTGRDQLPAGFSLLG